MIQDATTMISGSVSSVTNALTGQNVFSAGTTVLSTNAIDLGSVRDVGEGSMVLFSFTTTIAAVGGTSIECQIIAADDAALSTNVAVIGTTGAIPVASLTLGARFSCATNPRLNSKGQRYIGARYISVGTTTAGAMLCSVVGDSQTGVAKIYPSGYSVA